TTMCTRGRSAPTRRVRARGRSAFSAAEAGNRASTACALPPAALTPRILPPTTSGFASFANATEFEAPNCRDSEKAPENWIARLAPAIHSPRRGFRCPLVVMSIAANPAIGENALFAGVPFEAIDHVAERMRTVFYPGGEVIFREGDPGHGLYLVLAGSVR